jgi:hypothetical protein
MSGSAVTTGSRKACARAGRGAQPLRGGSPSAGMPCAASPTMHLPHELRSIDVVHRPDPSLRAHATRLCLEPGEGASCG